MYNEQVLKIMMQVMSPVMTTLGAVIVQGINESIFSKRQEGQVRNIFSSETQRVEQKFERQAAESALRVRNALVEDMYRNDRIDCRQRFKTYASVVWMTT